MAKDYGKLARDGLWNNNTSFVQILGLCPLLAVSATVTNALGLGLATTAVLVASNVTVSLIRNVVRPEIRIAVFVLVIASFVSAVQLVMNAYFHTLYKVLGIFVPLIVTNCVIIGRAEAFASKNSVDRSFVDGLMMGIGLTLSLTALGALREVVGHGTLLTQAGVMFGPAFAHATVTVIGHYRGFLLAALPPGAFLGLGFLIALKNVIDRHSQRRAERRAPTPQQMGIEPVP